MSSPLDLAQKNIDSQRPDGVVVVFGIDFAERLVAVARAAEDLLRDDDMPNHWDDCVCSYCTRNRSLREALSRLGKDTAA